MKKALKFSSEDTVAVVLETVSPGDKVGINGEEIEITASQKILKGHKLAIGDIDEGTPVSKYGHVIGTAGKKISRGAHVHDHNLKDQVAEWRKGQYQFSSSEFTEISDDYVLKDKPTLYGYRRKNGTVGFRNHLLVISTVVCANQIVENMGAKYKDVIALSNPSGCVILPNEVERIKAILLGMARNPNVGAVIFVGLGCENIEAEWLYEQVKNEKPAAFIREQTEGSSTESEEKLEKQIIIMRKLLTEKQREEVSFSDIRLATKCGGSDWTTAVVSNPAIGIASDYVVKNGGISMIGETVGWFGGEGVLIKQARNRKVADGINELLEDMYNRALSVGRRIEEGNPTPGNKDGGLSTLTEKALGNVKKGGTAPIEGVLGVGEYPKEKGFYVVDNPGLDPLSLLGLTCSSANIVLFSTGRGTPTGTPIAPSIKLTGSPEAMNVFSAHMDVDLTGVITGSLSLKEAGLRLLDEIIDVANGKQTIAERLGHREYAFPLLMAPL